jgi:CheY-like chemotaxis protein
MRQPRTLAAPHLSDSRFVASHNGFYTKVWLSRAFRTDYPEYRKPIDNSQGCRAFAREVTQGDLVTPGALVSIVEDDESVRKATENLIRSLGWSVLSFESAAAYLSSGAVSRTGCLISDVTMSEMTGIEMHAHLISQGCAPPTLFITGFPNARDEALVLANGALAYLEKPVESQVILNWVQKLIGTP